MNVNVIEITALPHKDTLIERTLVGDALVVERALINGVEKVFILSPHDEAVEITA